MCEEEQTELLLIAGDLFHRQPLLRELKEVDYLFGSLTKTQVVQEIMTILGRIPITVHSLGVQMYI